MAQKIMLFFALLLLAGCATAPQGAPPLKIGINFWPGHAAFILAEENGIFKQHGVDVELVLFPDMNSLIDSYRAGRVDGAVQVTPDTIMLNADRHSAVIVYIIDVSSGTDVLVGKPDISNLSVLVNKTLGVDGVNSFSHFFAQSLLERSGVQEGDYFIKNTPVMDVLDSLENGSIDAGHTWEPETSAALAKGYKILGSSKDTPGLITDVLVFPRQVILDRASDVQNVVAALLESQSIVGKREDVNDAIIAKRLGMSVSDLRNAYDGLIFPDMETNIRYLQDSSSGSVRSSTSEIATFFLERGQIDALPAMDAMVDPSFIGGKR